MQAQRPRILHGVRKEGRGPFSLQAANLAPWDPRGLPPKPAALVLPQFRALGQCQSRYKGSAVVPTANSFSATSSAVPTAALFLICHPEWTEVHEEPVFT